MIHWSRRRYAARAIGEHAAHQVFVHVAVSAMQLDESVEHLLLHVRRPPFGHRSGLCIELPSTRSLTQRSVTTRAMRTMVASSASLKRVFWNSHMGWPKVLRRHVLQCLFDGALHGANGPTAITIRS